MNGWVVEQLIFGQWCGANRDQHSSSDCVRQVERKGGMSDVGVSPLVQAPVLIQDMGTVHDSTCAEVTERRFWGSSD